MGFSSTCRPLLSKVAGGLGFRIRQAEARSNSDPRQTVWGREDPAPASSIAPSSLSSSLALTRQAPMVTTLFLLLYLDISAAGCAERRQASPGQGSPDSAQTKRPKNVRERDINTAEVLGELEWAHAWTFRWFVLQQGGTSDISHTQFRPRGTGPIQAFMAGINPTEMGDGTGCEHRVGFLPIINYSC